MRIDETKLGENAKLTKMVLKRLDGHNEEEALIYDNCLPNEQFLQIKNLLITKTRVMPWFFSENIVSNLSPEVLEIFRKKGYKNDDVSQFTHLFHHVGNYSWSNFTEGILPLLELINPKAWIRVKANLGMKEEKHLIGGWHYDMNSACNSNNIAFNSMIGTFNVNTNNGYTLLETGDKIESIENRLVIFPCNIFHTGVTQTDTKRRVLLNLNFFI